MVHGTAVDKGWWDHQVVQVEADVPNFDDDVVVAARVQRTFGELMALVHSEVSEALEDHRRGRKPDKISWSFTSGGEASKTMQRVFSEEGGVRVELDGGRTVEMTPDNCHLFGFIAKPYGIPTELADIIIRVLDIAGWYDIDMEEAMLIKSKYNQSREHRHGGKVL
jgi:hypothetical protein